MTDGVCKLCQQERALQLSHVLPAFVFRWLRETGGTNHLRSTREPNRRVQDGPKFRWLCLECEQRFSRVEKAFADYLFYPYTNNSGIKVMYGPWLLKFAVSLAWRVLHLHLQEADSENGLHSKSMVAEQVWRDHLLDKNRNPRSYRQHLLPVGEINSTSMDVAPNINRYLARAVQVDLLTKGHSVMTYAKLGPFMFFGCVFKPQPEEWHGTKIHGAEGLFGPRKYVVPASLADYFNDTARSTATTIANISSNQKARIRDAFEKNMDQYVGSDLFRAMARDIAMFGPLAFTDGDPLEGS